MKNLFTVLIFALFSTSSPLTAGPIEDVGVILNDYRLANSRKALIASPSLNQAAQAHAEDMYKNEYFSHKGKNGSSVKKRVKATGFKACYWGENIAWGQKDAATVMKTWQQSKGHNKNMLNKKPTHFGIGKMGPYWVQVFAKKC